VSAAAAPATPTNRSCRVLEYRQPASQGSIATGRTTI
jgi:hypothetical protein